MKKNIIGLLISLTSIILMLFILEVYARFVNPIFKIPHGHISLGIGGKDVLEYPSGYIKDRELFWRLEPSLGDYNSKGFRDREFSLNKKDNKTFRIICMGDSVTFGWPSKLEHTYPKQLEKLLSLQFPEKNFEVLNAGVPGYTSYQGLKLLQRDLIHYQPDLIIVYFAVNDRAGCYKPDKEQRILPGWIIWLENYYLRKFQFYKLLNKILLYFKYPLDRENHYPAHRVSPQDYRGNLEAMAKIGKDNGLKTLFITKPVFYDPKEKIVFTDKRYVLPEDISQFDIYSIFKRREDEANELFVDDCRPFNFHLTEKGQRILAEEIFYFLNKNKIIE